MRESSKKFKHKHSLGQNFIVDEFIFDDIVRESGITKDDLVLEIGPGNGAMTRTLCENAKYVVSVEVDKTLMPLLKENLKEYNNVKIINADFLNCDFNIILDAFKGGLAELAPTNNGLAVLAPTNNGLRKRSPLHELTTAGIKVVANIPYYITSPIIMALLTNPYIFEMTLMVQKEVGLRIIAEKGNKDFGVLTLACNYFADTFGLFLVPRTAFFPVPKVDSAVVKFVKHREFVKSVNEEERARRDHSYERNIQSYEDDENYKKLFKVIKAAFQERRKKLINSLNNVLGIDKAKLNDVIKELGFSENVRAEELSLDDYRKLIELI